VRGTVEVTGASYARLEVGVCPRLATPAGDHDVHGLERAVELEPSSGPIPFDVEVPAAPPAWKGEALRVGWRVFARVHPERGGATTHRVPLLVEPTPGVRPRFDVQPHPPSSETGCGWVALVLANVVAGFFAWSLVPDDPWLALAFSPVLLLDAGVIAAAVADARARRLAGVGLALRVPDGRSPYRDGPVSDPELQVVVTDAPAGTRAVTVHLECREQWRESTGGKGSVVHARERFAERVALRERDGEWAGTLPLPDFGELGWSIDAYFAGVRWRAALEVVVAGSPADEGTTLRALRPVVVRPELR